MVGNKAIYEGLLEERRILKGETNNVVANVEGFSDSGWELTIKEVEKMLSSMKELVKLKGDRKTPQFYKPLYNRAIIVQQDIKKVIDTINGVKIDYAVECQKLRDEIAAIYAERAASEDTPDV